MRWTSGFKISSCGNEPRTLSPRAYTTLTSCWFFVSLQFRPKKRLDLVTRMKMVWQNRDILKQSFFEVHGQKKKKKTPYKNEKRKHAKKFRRPSHGARQKKNSELSETKFQKKKFQKKVSKTDNEVLLPARESMKRPLTPFFPLPWRPSLRNSRLSESRASINIKIVALDLRV